MRVYPNRPSVLTHPTPSATARRVVMPKYPAMESVNSSSGALLMIVNCRNRMDKHGAKKSGGNKGSVGDKKDSDEEEGIVLREYSKALSLTI